MAGRDWQDLARADRRGLLMTKMMEATGVSATGLGALDLRAAERRCAACRHGRDCNRWLARNAVADQPPAFCANAALFETVKDD